MVEQTEREKALEKYLKEEAAKAAEAFRKLQEEERRKREGDRQQ